MKLLQVRVLEPIIVKCTYEMPDWYMRIELKTGICPMGFNNFGMNDFFEANIPGTIVASHFQSSFCGNPINKFSNNCDVGITMIWAVCYKKDSYWNGERQQHEGKLLIEEFR